MTPSPPPPQDLAAATFHGWGEFTTAWIDAATKWWFTILEWAVDECAYTGVNQTTSYAKVSKSTRLRGDFYRVDDASRGCIAATCVSIGHATDEALAKVAAPNRTAAPPKGSVLLVVTIRPGGEVRPGGYRGDVINASNGKKVAESLYIYVATDATPVATILTP